MDKNTQLYEDYFLSQSGAGGINVFSGPRYMKGRGLGRILGGLGRVLLPLIKRGGRVLLQEGIRTGTDIAGDVIGGKNIASSFKKRGREAGERLVHRAVKRMRGDGLMPAPPGQPFQTRRKRRSTKRKRQVPKHRKKKKKRKQKSTAIKRRKSNASNQKKRKHSAGRRKKKTVDKKFRDIFT